MPAAHNLSPLPTTTFHILLSLVDGAAHGYGIKHLVEERTDGQVQLAAGTLYESMQRLLRQRLIERAERPDGVGGSARWRFYCITKLGGDVLAAELERLERDIAYARTKLPAAQPQHG